jgi:hypothetical protein
MMREWEYKEEKVEHLTCWGRRGPGVGGQDPPDTGRGRIAVFNRVGLTMCGWCGIVTSP